MKQVHLLFGVVTILLAGCSGAGPVLPPLSSPTPPPIPTDIQVDLPPATAESGEEADADPVEESDPQEAAEPDGPTMTRLTGPGCCVQPFWSSDGQTVLFIDQPQPTAPVGIYGVDLEGGEPTLIREQIGLPSPDGRYHAFVSEDGDTIVQTIDGGDQWEIPSGGRRVFFSPQSTRLAWAVIEESGNFDQREAVIFVSDIDGGNVEEIISVIGGGIAGWLDDDTLLLTGRQQRGNQDQALFSLSVVDGTRTDLLFNQRIRSVRVAPGGAWIVYTITLHPDSTDEDGLWVINADGTQRYKLDVIGTAQWRDDHHLLVIPFEPGAVSHRLWQFEAESGEVQSLTDPEVFQFKIQAGDWQVSPTGDHLVFVNSEDTSLWLIDLLPLE